jgi:hypothetical protein
MLHRSRQWSVWPVDSAEALAAMLVQSTWTGCQAFIFAGYLFANDATSSDGAQEYAVLKPNANGSSLSQIESITFSWCSEERALELIREILLGKFDANSFYNVARDQFSSPAKHGTCFLCA